MQQNLMNETFQRGIDAVCGLRLSLKKWRWVYGGGDGDDGEYNRKQNHLQNGFFIGSSTNLESSQKRRQT